MLIVIFAFLTAMAPASEIQTNAVTMPDAPKWLKRTRVEKITDRIQTHLEWTIRKIEVLWYANEAAFQKAHKLGPGVRAVANKTTNKIHMGPLVNDAEFDSVFGHELVHIILGQKYKQAIPPWLEEGLANHLAKHGKVNYAWLNQQPFPEDVRKLGHPFAATTVSSPRYHYQASQALAEMLAKKCDLPNLLRLSVGKSMENYLDTYCEIKDLNADFRKWVKSRAT